MLAEYYFKIKYIKSINNIKTDIFNRKAELQSNKKIKEVILKIHKNNKIRYNYL